MVLAEQKEVSQDLIKELRQRFVNKLESEGAPVKGELFVLFIQISYDIKKNNVNHSNFHYNSGYIYVINLKTNS